MIYIDPHKLKPAVAEAIAKQVGNPFEQAICNSVACQFIDECVKTCGVDCEPVRHGHWKRIFNDANPLGYLACSYCGQEPLGDDDRHYVESGFCPHCGTTMDEEVNNEQNGSD